MKKEPNIFPQGSNMSLNPERRLTPERQTTLQNKAEEVINLIGTKGLSLRKACIKVDIPNNTMLNYIEQDTRLIEQYTRAIDLRNDIHAQKIIKLAHNRTNDFYTDKDGNIKPNPVAVQRDRLIIDSEKWLLSKLAPKKYGDRINIDAKIEHTQPLSIDQVNDILKQIDNNTIDITNQQ